MLVAEIATGVYAYQNRHQLSKIVKSSVAQSIKYEYGTNQLQTQTFDAFQKHVSFQLPHTKYILSLTFTLSPRFYIIFQFQSRFVDLIKKRNLILIITDITLSFLNPKKN